jgi:hypothetical protein
MVIKSKFQNGRNPAVTGGAPQFCSHWAKNTVNVGRAADIFGGGQVSGFGRIVLIGAVLAGLGAAAVRAQTVLGDPRDAAKTFAANCSACHKSPQGLAKSGQIAGFLRQHYTTGPEMSAAMAAYLVAAGNAPAAKKGAATAENATPGRIKGKKGEQLAAQPQGERAETVHERTLRGKQRPVKPHEEEAAQHPAASPGPTPPAEETKQTATAALNVTPPAPSAEPPPIVLDLPLPPMPDAPPPELSQSVFSSSPLP